MQIRTKVPKKRIRNLLTVETRQISYIREVSPVDLLDQTLDEKCLDSKTEMKLTESADLSKNNASFYAKFEKPEKMLEQEQIVLSESENTAPKLL